MVAYKDITWCTLRDWILLTIDVVSSVSQFMSPVAFSPYGCNAKIRRNVQAIDSMWLWRKSAVIEAQKEREETCEEIIKGAKAPNRVSREKEEERGEEEWTSLLLWLILRDTPIYSCDSPGDRIRFKSISEHWSGIQREWTKAIRLRTAIRSKDNFPLVIGSPVFLSFDSSTLTEKRSNAQYLPFISTSLTGPLIDKHWS